MMMYGEYLLSGYCGKGKNVPHLYLAIFYNKYIINAYAKHFIDMQWALYLMSNKIPALWRGFAILYQLI